MSSIFEDESVRQRDAWVSIIGCFLILIISGFILIPLLRSIFPSLSKITLDQPFAILSLIVPVIYLTFRYGRFGMSDFALHGSDFAVLVIALIILFVMMSFLAFQGPYDTSMVYDKTISNLAWPEYSFTLISILFLGPFLEETLFRRYVFEIFRSKYHILAALALTSLIETFLHSGHGISGLVGIFASSIFFTLVYMKSRLGVSFVIHSLTNIFIYFIVWR